MGWLDLAAAPTTITTVVTSLLLRRGGFNNNKSVLSTKSCRAAMLLLIHQTSFFTTTTFNSSSSKFGGGGGGGGGGSFILHQQQQQQQANNNFHTTTTTSSKFGTIILQTNEPSVFNYYGEEVKKDIIKMFMLSSAGYVSGSDGEEEEDKYDQKKKVFKLDEDLGFAEICKDFNLQDSTRMVGSYNGIICLHDHDPERRLKDDSEVRFPTRDVYLWNPAIRHFRILPESKHMQQERIDYKVAFKDFIGFGFDIETQDYKVLRITPFVPHSYVKEDRCMCLVQVYSLSTDSWRVLNGIDFLPLSPTPDLFENRQGTYLKGSCFFVGSKPINCYGIRDLILMSFDFTKEIFTIIDFPESYCHKLVLSSHDSSGKEEDFDDILGSPPGGLYDIRADKPVVFRTSQVDKQLVFRTPRIDFAGGYAFTTPLIDSKGVNWYYHLWVLNEQRGSNGSSGRVVEYEPNWWTLLHEFRIETKSKHPPYSEPRFVSKDGEFALISTTLTDDNGRKKLMLFNLVTKKAVKDFTIGDHRDCTAAYVYKQSQVSIMGAGNALLRWQLPTHGTTYKLNMDAPFIGCFNYFGIGLCLTSDKGGCIGVRSVKRDMGGAKEGEAMAMLEAIKWAIKLELSPIIIESDSKNMVSFFMEDDNMVSSFMEKDDDDYISLSYHGRSRASSFLKSAKLLLKSSENSISFQYCSRSSNYVAEIASKLGSDNWPTWSCKDWTANFPGEVIMSLSKDSGLVVH